MIRVMLVDDHNLIREGLKHLLLDSKLVDVVGEAASGEDAINVARETKPDVILMDIHMPGIGGFGATKRILQMLPKTKIIILTAYAHDILSSRLIQTGAYGYMMKTSGPNDIIKAIKTVSKGEHFISPEIMNKLALAQINDYSGSPFKNLSDKELQIVLMIGQGITVKEIAKRLHLSEKTINTYRYSIFEKLGVRNNVGATLEAVRYRLLDIPSKKELMQGAVIDDNDE
ncbi:MAG: hypothetical protein A2298_03460 [Gammaproteobacteria bacterium RIFOXYB2_FULL_38_6]|nr:MAG: hypothetical protein A2298_03460 [Gammaproteobacteria bacterium RIFOXYB2_FULL_38_6]